MFLLVSVHNLEILLTVPGSTAHNVAGSLEQKGLAPERDGNVFAGILVTTFSFTAALHGFGK